MRSLFVTAAVVACVALPTGARSQAAASQAAAGSSAGAGARTSADLARQRARAARVTIVRDTWGVAHVYGRSDADAVFGMVYAQAEDDFPRVERNYINAMGRLAEVEGEAELWRDLRMKLFVEPGALRAQYATSPAWLRALMDAWADGLNHYLATHPEVRPRLLTRFEPWMALSFTEGSIGGDIESIDLGALARFYGPRAAGAAPASAPPASAAPTGAAPAGAPARAPRDAGDARAMRDPGGSNGFAIAPARSASGHALLLINPHTSFYFRPEIHVVSEAGLNAYGAVTWGQFFVYQGFNDRAGWMHTSDAGDVIDEYLETVAERGGRLAYRYGAGERPVRTRTITLPYRLPSGAMGRRTVTAYFTHHGPVVRTEGDRWVAVRLMQEPVRALQQSYLRTKARSYDEFARVLELRTNSSNNTVYADADGTIAYWHGNFLPVRDTSFDWTRPVDGSDPRTEWRGLHRASEVIALKNPANGWIQNTNNWPFSAAGPESPRRERFPRYTWTNGENPRGIHAVRVLSRDSAFTLDGLIAAAYDPELPGFEPLLPPLFAAYDALPAGDSLRTRLGEQIGVLRAWDRRWGLASVATSLAVYWGEALARGTRAGDYERLLAASPTARDRLEALVAASARLERDFGTWRTPWGEINRFQRPSADVTLRFDDARPSLPVPFTSAVWGSLASIDQRGERTTRRRYGTYGNSFVAVVEFGPRVRARSVLAGGVSGDPASPHFADQAPLYARGAFKEVPFHRDEVERQARRTYRPGARDTSGRAEMSR